MDALSMQRVQQLEELIGRIKRYYKDPPIGNLTLNEIAALEIINKGKKEKGSALTMSEAGELLGLGRSATSQMVGRMERKGMLKREIVLLDRRKTTVKLTEKGAAIINGRDERRRKSIENAINVLGVDNVDVLIKLITQYLNVVEEEKC